MKTKGGLSFAPLGSFNFAAVLIQSNDVARVKLQCADFCPNNVGVVARRDVSSFVGIDPAP